MLNFQSTVQDKKNTYENKMESNKLAIAISGKSTL